MAQSRLEKIGTIFTRVTGLLRTGAMKPEDKPIWYDVYEAFPPKLEPRYDRPAPNIPIRKIYYEEDVTRAKFHKIHKPDLVNFSDNKRETHTQQFIKIYNELKAQGPLDEAQLFETAREMLMERIKENRATAAASKEMALELEDLEAETTTIERVTPAPAGNKSNLYEIFAAAKETETSTETSTETKQQITNAEEALESTTTKEKKSPTPVSGSKINIENIFKD